MTLRTSLLFVLMFSLSGPATAAKQEASSRAVLEGWGCVAELSDQTEIWKLRKELIDLEQQVAALNQVLQGVERIIDPFTGQDTIRFSDMNVQIVSGMEPYFEGTNGRGNLIIGYNVPIWTDPDGMREGSHMLIVGDDLSYSEESYGGIVAGLEHFHSGSWSSILGGHLNSTSADRFATVVGGIGNRAEGRYSVVAGGYINYATEEESAVFGGALNRANGHGASVHGGYYNMATGEFSVISGGGRNVALGERASASGGYRNTVFGVNSAVSGGLHNQAVGDGSSVSGGSWNTAYGNRSSVSGGTGKYAGENKCWEGDPSTDC